MMDKKSNNLDSPAHFQSPQADGTLAEPLINAKCYQKLNSTSEVTKNIHSDTSNDSFDSKRLNIENDEASYFKLMKDNASFRLFICSYFATMSGE